MPVDRNDCTPPADRPVVGHSPVPRAGLTRDLTPTSFQDLRLSHDLLLLETKPSRRLGPFEDDTGTHVSFDPRGHRRATPAGSTYVEDLVTPTS